MQVPKELEEDAEPMLRCEEKRNAWAKHWRSDSEVQGAEDMLWNEDSRRLGEGLLQLKEKFGERAARSVAVIDHWFWL